MEIQVADGVIVVLCMPALPGVHTRKEIGEDGIPYAANEDRTCFR